MLRWMIGLCIAVVVLVTVFWFAGARSLENAAQTWIEDRRSDDWQAEWSDLNVQGFPNRFDISIQDLQLADPETGLVWSAPRFEILSLSYKPNHMIFTWPPEQVLQTPNQKISIKGEKLQGSVVLKPQTDLALDRAIFIFDGVTLISDAGWRMQLDQARMQTLSTPAIPKERTIGFEARALRPPLAVLDTLKAASDLPETLDQVRADMSITFDREWNRFAIEQRRPQPRAIDLRLAQATWGKLDLKLTGKLKVDSAGIPTGELLVKATNWREILALGVATGIVPRDFASPLETALALVSQLAGHPETLDIPISFSQGQAFAGPVPIGAAPILRIR